MFPSGPGGRFIADAFDIYMRYKSDFNVSTEATMAADFQGILLYVAWSVLFNYAVQLQL